MYARGETMADKKNAPDIGAMSFEEALEELKTIVTKLESGEAKLDDAIADYERGTALKKHCEGKLRQAQAKLEKINLAPDGTVTAEPADKG